MIEKVLRGVVRGDTIQLQDEVGIADGERVEIVIRRVVPQVRQREALLRTEGALADDPEWDAIVEEIRQSRLATNY